MTPTIVTKNGKVVLITGSPGGRTIINTVLHVVLGVTEFGMNVREAVDAPRMHHQWLPDTVDDRARRRVRRGRAAAAPRDGPHGRASGGAQGDANSIWVDAGGTAWGANDKRSADGKASAAGALDFDRGADNRLNGRCSVSRTTTGTTIPASAGRSSCACTDNDRTQITQPFTGPAGHSGGAFFLWHGTSMDFSKLDGLIPAVIQDARIGEVLMVGFMNEEALDRTRDDRLRHLLQPHAQHAVDEGRDVRQPARRSIEMLVDCDDDTVLVKVKRLGDGNVCHTGERTCFFRAARRSVTMP